MNNIPGFCKRVKDSLEFSQDGKLIYYVPEIYFERGYAVIVGDVIKLMGLFNYARFDKNNKKLSFKNFNFPTLFECTPSSVEKVKELKLTKYSKIQDYRLLIFKKGDLLVNSVKVPQDIENSEMLYKMFSTGVLPNTIPYDKLHEIFIENIKLNGANYDLSIQMFGIMISELCRDSNNIEKLFRQTDIKDMTNYQYITLKQAPKLISPFASITSENWDEAVVYALNNKKAKYSPLEKLFTL